MGDGLCGSIGQLTANQRAAFDQETTNFLPFSFHEQLPTCAFKCGDKSAHDDMEIYMRAQRELLNEPTGTTGCAPTATTNSKIPLVIADIGRPHAHKSAFRAAYKA